MWARGDRIGRDGARTPIPWSGEAPGFGFTTGDAWMPFDYQAVTRNIESLAADPESILSIYKRLIAVRREIRPRVAGRASWPESPADLVVVNQPLDDGRTLVVACNTSDDPVRLPLKGEPEVLFGTGEVSMTRHGVEVAGTSTVWLAC